MASDLMQQSAKLAKRLAAIPGEILVHVRPALVQAADDLAGLARTLAPEDEGDLKASNTVIPPGGMTPTYAEGGGKRTAADSQSLVSAGTPQVRHGIRWNSAPTRISTLPVRQNLVLMRALQRRRTLLCNSERAVSGPL